MLDAASISGFSSWVNFFKACVALGAILGTVVWSTITWGLDDRYADKSVEGEVQGLSASVKQIRKLQIITAVPVTQSTACGASGPAIQAYAQQVEALKAEYKVLVGEDLYVPACADLAQ